MSTTATPRTWSAKIVIGNEIFDAKLSDYDLKKDQTKSAVQEIVELIEAGIVQGGRVDMFKTTKAGTRPDATIRVWFDRDKIRTF